MAPATDTLFAAAQALHRAGRSAEARERCQRLLEQAPDHGGALHLLALLAFREGERGSAAALFGQAAALALLRGNADTALQRAVEALTAQESSQTRSLFAGIAGALRFTQDDPVVRPLLIRALTEGWGPAAPLARAAAGLVRHALEDDALLQAALAAAPIADAALEETLTRKRRDLLAAGEDSAFAAALARQCFLNGYVFAQSAEETAQVAALRGRIERGARSGLAVLGCYMPLGALANAHDLAATGMLADVLKQQRDQPEEEKAIAAALPALTPIGANPPEHEPWPRWSGAPAPDAPVTLRDYLAARFALAAPERLPERPALLVAGCGTGEYALHLAGMLALDSVTAMDLSRANLAYAARKAKEAGLAVQFGQGDILQAAALDRRFGLIECGGVLHQLPDPLAGWSALLAALEPGGVMRLAVHSAAARAALAPLRQKLAGKGFAPTPDGIRAARRWLRSRGEPAMAGLLEAPEFFTLGGCRHLLFPEEEHPLALARIAAFLRENRLEMLGLEVPPALGAAYRARFPGDAAAADLDNWAAFEQENPQSFAAMIQFWVRKAG